MLQGKLTPACEFPFVCFQVSEFKRTCVPSGTRDAEWHVKRKIAGTKRSKHFQVHPAAERPPGRVSRAWGTCSRKLYFFPLFEHDKDLYGIFNPSARWITIELLHRLFFKRQVRLCWITLCPSLGKIGSQVADPFIGAIFPCVVSVVTH